MTRDRNLTRKTRNLVARDIFWTGASLVNEGVVISVDVNALDMREFSSIVNVRQNRSLHRIIYDNVVNRLVRVKHNYFHVTEEKTSLFQ